MLRVSIEDDRSRHEELPGYDPVFSAAWITSPKFTDEARTSRGVVSHDELLPTNSDNGLHRAAVGVECDGHPGYKGRHRCSDTLDVEHG
jgi:hypothetical protein